MIQIGDVVQACYTADSIHFTVENTGSADLSGLSVFVDADYDITMHIREPIAAGDVSQQSINFGTQVISGVEHLVMIPIIGENDMLCTGAAIERGITPC